jgi:uncharacterized protein
VCRGVARAEWVGAGIGRALALELASRHGTLALTGRRPEPLAETAALVAKHGGTAHTITADLAADGEPERVVAETVTALGGLDILVNNAGNVRAGLEARHIDIDTQVPERLALQELNARDPLAVDAVLAPKLDQLRTAVSTHRSI